MHAAWADHLASTSADGVDICRLGDLATHQELAGADAAAFGSLLQAADVAEGLGVRREAADLLARAAALWSTGAPHPHTTTRTSTPATGEPCLRTRGPRRRCLETDRSGVRPRGPRS